MDKPVVIIMYENADGSRTRLEVSVEVESLLEQSDRQRRSQKRQGRRRHTDYIDGLTDTTTVVPHEDFAELIDRIDSYKRLYAAIDMLPEPQRRRVQLYYFGGFTYSQIAEFEGVHHSSIIRAVKQARESLKKLLQQ